MEEGAGRIDTLQAVELAEGLEVRLRIAGPLLRGMALGIDVAIQITGLIVVGVVLPTAPAPPAAPAPAGPARLVVKPNLSSTAAREATRIGE